MTDKQAEQRGIDVQASCGRDPCPAAYAAIEARLHEAGVTWVEWAAPQENGNLLFACDGCIYRLTDWQNIDTQNYLKKARLLADFNDLVFQQMRAPSEAMRW